MSIQPARKFPAILFSSGLLLIAGLAGAQEGNPSRAEIEALLAERDAIIIALQNSVRELEERLEAIETEDAVPSAGASAAGPRPAEPADRAVGGSDDSASALAVDPDLAERALERTLVQGGSLLLRPGSWEFVPSLSYGVAELGYPESVPNPGGMPIVGRTDVARTSFGLDLEFRVGLPAGSQLEFGIPYVSASQESAFSVAGRTITGSRVFGSGPGDFRIGFARTLARESGSRPDLVGRITYGSGSGDRTDDGVELGGGFEYLEGSLSLLKRRDPLALLLTVGYRNAEAKNGFDPGDSARLSLGAAMAASPESSLFGTLNYTRFDSSAINGQAVTDSELDITSLNIGLSTILRGGRLLSVFTQFGISEQAPDYSVGFSLPTRW